MKANNKDRWKAITCIARQHFNVDTLETRNRDDLDCYDVAVWSIRDALEAAYMAGQQHAVDHQIPQQPDKESDHG